MKILIGLIIGALFGFVAGYVRCLYVSAKNTIAYFVFSGRTPNNSTELTNEILKGKYLKEVSDLEKI